MNFIPSSSIEFTKLIRNTLGDPSDLRFESQAMGKAIITYISPMVNQTDLQTNLVAPLKQLDLMNTQYTWEEVLMHLTQVGGVKRENINDIISDLMWGKAVVHLNGNSLAYSFNTQRSIRRQPSDPLTERTVRGPRISLLEMLEDNLLIIRQAIKDQALRFREIKVGRRTQTKVVMAYLENVANPKLVQEVKWRITKIDIDGMIDSGYLEQLISDNRWSIFPLTQATERPDKLVAGILEGRVVILVDGSSNAIVVPVTANELYQSPEDYYFGFWFGSFLRFFRILGNNIAVTLPGLYIALVGVNPELLPIKFTLTVSGSRAGVAIPLLIELLILEVTVEIFREASLRLPTTVSQTLGVTAGIILGIAAVGAGLVSNATLVVVIVTAIASYSGPNYNIGLSWRILKFVLIFAAAFLGLFGLTFTGLMILAHAAIQNSFGTAFLSPWSPLRPKELIDTILRRPLWFPHRPVTYHPVDKVRNQDFGGGQDDDEQN
ncbi:MAG TPA: spore germination protein [Bacillota bacterium]|nr:spore germination protein [Bacillota bacterium]